ncbi:peptidoglycan-binding domain-containing protein [Albidovulum sp.]|uniref:peptidoglycan-binding domain-containing protein n=1 Tax=Albidovulum sp. TaxID=1872424 RepID=UPI0039B85194
MLPKIRNTATAAIAALSIAAALPAPAFAWGEKEQNALAAIVAAGVIGTLVLKENQRRRAAPVTRAPVQTYYQPRYDAPAATRYQPALPSGIYATPAANAFNSYSPAERRRIQSRLAEAGYYRGGIDGAFGPMTYRAILAIAGDSTGTDQLDSMGGAYEFYDTILG